MNLGPADAAGRMLVGQRAHPPAADSDFHFVNLTPTRVRDVIEWLAAEGYAVRGYPEAK